MARHPLHPALVHFPVACWSLATVADCASLYFGQAAWQWSAGLLAVGCGMALLAMMAGLYELARVPEGRPLEHAYWHMGLVFMAFTLYVVRLLLGLDLSQGYWQPQAPDVWAIATSVLGFVTLLAGAYVGGRLVYEHGIGR